MPAEILSTDRRWQSYTSGVQGWDVFRGRTVHGTRRATLVVMLVVAAVLAMIALIATALTWLLGGSGDATGAAGARIVAAVAAGLLVTDLGGMVVLLALDRLARDNRA